MHYTEKFAKRFAESTDEELIEFYNREVGQNGWVSTRATYLYCLHKEIESRDFDSSLIIRGNIMSLTQKIKLQEGKLIYIDSPKN